MVLFLNPFTKVIGYGAEFCGWNGNAWKIHHSLQGAEIECSETTSTKGSVNAINNGGL